MSPGDKVIARPQGPYGLGAFDRSCWTPEEGRLTARLYFDDEVRAYDGDQIELLAADDRPDMEGWWLGLFRKDGLSYVIPLHEDMVEKS